MKKSIFTVVLTLTCLLGLGISARAQDIDKVTVNVPFDFVAGGETLPAGTYSVSRVSPEINRSLAIRNNANSVVPKGEASTTVNHQPNAMPQPTGEMSRAEVSQTGRKVKPQFGQKGERPDVVTNPTDKTGTPQ